MSFSLNVDNGIETRAISDGQTVNQLVVVVYEDGIELEALRSTSYWPLETNHIDIRLIKDREYQVLFWLHHVGENNESAYSIARNGDVTINYEEFLSCGFAKMEQLDAFFALRTVNPSEETDNKVNLIRPVAQLNFADPDNANADKDAAIKLKNVVTSYNILTGQTVENPDEMTFIFNGEPTDEGDRLNSGTESYNYIASIYLFPTIVQATYQIDGLEDKNIGTIPLKANTRTNIIGPLVPTAGTQDESN